MTHPTDEELDALENRLKEPWNQRQSRRVAEEFDAADAITSLRTQLAEVSHMLALSKLTTEAVLARAERSEAALAEADAMIEAQAKDHAENNIRLAETSYRADRSEAALVAQPSPDVAALVEAADKLLDAYSAIVGAGNPWGDELRAALARVKDGEA